ncbi:MAG: hypothetical protein Q4G68_03020 [Planctomycetia bacterium]|nr:hypothetical protein [Planctomycetia bacterium]
MRSTLSYQGIVLLLGLVSLFFVAPAVHSEETEQAKRERFAKEFNELSTRSVKILEEAAQEATKEVSKGAADFDMGKALSKLTIAGEIEDKEKEGEKEKEKENPTELGIKVWFELKDGTLVNPIKHKWTNKEEFYIHVQAAVPVFVSLYQNYPEDRPRSRQISPDDQYPETFKAINPGQKDTRLPVRFATDDDLRDEVISMVVVRADWKEIQNNTSSTVQNTTSTATTDSTRNSTTTTSGNGNIVVTTTINSNGVGTMKGINDVVNRLKSGESMNDAETNQAKSAKMSIVGSLKEKSEVPDDVCMFMLKTGHVGQWQLTLFK